MSMQMAEQFFLSSLSLSLYRKPHLVPRATLRYQYINLLSDHVCLWELLSGGLCSEQTLEKKSLNHQINYLQHHRHIIYI